MRIISRKKQDEIIKETMQIIGSVCGRKIEPEVLEELANSTFRIVEATSGKRGLLMVLETLQEQIRLHAEIMMEEIKEGK